MRDFFLGQIVSRPPEKTIIEAAETKGPVEQDPFTFSQISSTEPSKEHRKALQAYKSDPFRNSSAITSSHREALEQSKLQASEDRVAAIPKTISEASQDFQLRVSKEISIEQSEGGQGKMGLPKEGPKPSKKAKNKKKMNQSAMNGFGAKPSTTEDVVLDDCALDVLYSSTDTGTSKGVHTLFSLALLEKPQVSRVPDTTLSAIDRNSACAQKADQGVNPAISPITDFAMSRESLDASKSDGNVSSASRSTSNDRSSSRKQRDTSHISLSSIGTEEGGKLSIQDIRHSKAESVSSAASSTLKSNPLSSKHQRQPQSSHSKNGSNTSLSSNNSVRKVDQKANAVKGKETTDPKAEVAITGENTTTTILAVVKKACEQSRIMHDLPEWPILEPAKAPPSASPDSKPPALSTVRSNNERIAPIKIVPVIPLSMERRRQS